MVELKMLYYGTKYANSAEIATTAIRPSTTASMAPEIRGAKQAFVATTRWDRATVIACYFTQRPRSLADAP